MSDGHAPAERDGGTTAVGTGRQSATRRQSNSRSSRPWAPVPARVAAPPPSAVCAPPVTGWIGVPVRSAGVGHTIEADRAPAAIGPVR